MFALDRIATLKKTKQKYHIDTKFDKDQYFRFSFGTTHRYDLQPEKVRLWFNKTNKGYILSQPLHHSQKIVEQSKVPVFLAGGINATNVQQAIEQVQPFGLDLCSGVRTDKKLDPYKLEQFFNAIYTL